MRIMYFNSSSVSLVELLNIIWSNFATLIEFELSRSCIIAGNSVYALRNSISSSGYATVTISVAVLFWCDTRHALCSKSAEQEMSGSKHRKPLKLVSSLYGQRCVNKSTFVFVVVGLLRNYERDQQTKNNTRTTVGLHCCFCSNHDWMSLIM